MVSATISCGHLERNPETARIVLMVHAASANLFRVATSVDGGFTWTDRGSFASVVDPLNIHLAHLGGLTWLMAENPNTTAGRIWRSTDDGETWAIIATHTATRIRRLAVISPTLVVGYANITGDNNVLVYSPDAGVSWRHANVDTGVATLTVGARRRIRARADGRRLDLALFAIW